MTPLAVSVEAWRRRTDVPAAGAAVLLAGGAAPSLAITGVRRRGGDDVVTPADRWHIGSCCKAITGAVIGTLVQDGATRWSATLPELFPDLDEIDDLWSDVTLDEVLTHVAGLPANVTTERMVAAMTDRQPVVEQRTEAVAEALAAKPAKRGKFVYSNLGYILAGAAIERLTGLAYEDAVRDRLLAPLEIASAGFGPPDGDDPWGHPPRFMAFGRGPAIDPASNSVDDPADNPPVMSPAGRLHLALGDWAKVIRLFLAPGDGLLSEATVDFMLTPPAANPKGQAIGWAPVTYSRGVWSRVGFAQQGSNRRWVATAALTPERDRAALVVCNDGRGRLLRSSIAFAARLLAGPT